MEDRKSTVEGMVNPLLDQSFWRNRKVFLTGHTGFKGSWLSSVLLHAGADVTGYSLMPDTTPSLFDILDLSSEMNSVVGDIRDYDSLQKAINRAQPDVVFHLAAQPIVRESYRNPVYTYETNVIGTVNILECVRQNGNVKSFINVTTDKVYENKEWNWGYRENDPLGGHDPYSNSKSCCELVTHSYRESFFQERDRTAISSVRSGNVIGGGDFATDRIIPDCVSAAQRQAHIMVRNPHSIRPYQFILDSLSGYLLLAQRQYEDKDKYEGSYNFGPDETDCVTTSTLVDMFCRKWGEETKWVSASDGGPHETSTLKLDCSKAKTILGWDPVYNIEESVNQTVIWYQTYSHGRDSKELTQQQIGEYWSKGTKVGIQDENQSSRLYSESSC